MSGTAPRRHDALAAVAHVLPLACGKPASRRCVVQSHGRGHCTSTKSPTTPIAALLRPKDSTLGGSDRSHCLCWLPPSDAIRIQSRCSGSKSGKFGLPDFQTVSSSPQSRWPCVAPFSSRVCSLWAWPQRCAAGRGAGGPVWPPPAARTHHLSPRAPSRPTRRPTPASRPPCGPRSTRI